ncbi:MAG TPA: hypothetical protein VND64_17320 [Pirellulales bacterium]|nr:hypothetical protein [Pirellulales bacterium]
MAEPHGENDLPGSTEFIPCPSSGQHPEHGPLPPEVALAAAGWPESPVPAALRAALLDRTTKLVRSRARSRRLRVAGGWLAAYAAGLATAWLALSHGEPAGREVPPKAVVAQVNSPSATPRGDVAGHEPDDEDALPPEELRRRVADAPRPEQLRLLRLAGDRYLYGRADVDNALDCYRQVLELTPRERRGAEEPDDSWLLAELRLADKERPAE